MKKGKRQNRNAEQAGRQYILYDSRACGGDTEDASILVVCDSNREAKTYKGSYGAMACFSYRVDGKNMVDDRWEWNYYD